MKIQEIQNIKQLADLLRCKQEFIDSIVRNGYFVTESLENHEIISNEIKKGNAVVHKFHIAKKNKSLGFRTVHEPLMDNLSNTLKILNNHLSVLYTPPSNIHGFVRGRNIKSNAEMHLGKKYILSLDIKDYFETITDNQIEKTLVSKGLSSLVSENIAKIATIQGKLVQGFHSSPTIANLVTESMDFKLKDFCSDTIIFSRYADDMYFSSDSKIPDINKLKEIVESFGFLINNSKTQLMLRGRKQYVTGLTVFDNLKPRISKKVKRNLRLEIHFISKFGLEEHIMKKLGYKRHQLKDIMIRGEVYDEIEKTKLRIWGWIHFIQSIEPELGFKFEEQMKSRKYNFC